MIHKFDGFKYRFGLEGNTFARHYYNINGEHLFSHIVDHYYNKLRYYKLYSNGESVLIYEGNLNELNSFFIKRNRKIKLKQLGI